MESVSFPSIRIRIKKWLDPGSGNISNGMDPDPTKTSVSDPHKFSSGSRIPKMSDPDADPDPRR